MVKSCSHWCRYSRCCGAIGGASKANHHAKDQQNAQKDSIEKSTESKEAKKKEKDYNNKKVQLSAQVQLVQ